MSRKVHQRTFLLLSAARPSINLTFSCKVFYSSSFLRKTDPQSTNYLKNRRDTLSLTTIVFARHFENEIPLIINHGREMSTISGNEELTVNLFPRFVNFKERAKLTYGCVIYFPATLTPYAHV